MSARWLLVTVVVGLVSACGENGVTGLDDVSSLTSAIANGQNDLDHPYVCAMVGRNSAGEVIGRVNMCSGVLISPQIMITAAHCGRFMDPDVSIRVECDPVVKAINFDGIPATVTYAPSALPDDALGFRPDFSVLHLERHIKLQKYGKMPRLFMNNDVFKDVAAGGGPALTVVGYGGASIPGSIEGRGSRRSGTMIFSGLDEFRLYTEANPGDIRPSDSGGPIFVAGSRRVLALAIGRVFPAVTKYFQRVDIPPTLDFLHEERDHDDGSNDDDDDHGDDD
jgi:hypothetical protein